ncbi:MAG: TonB-dependent receptor plug domain-containing protein [Roseivirga sp.]|nr:TonB-dependent receptor plug domain-containing protein [Roseivirga sp.]
MSKLPYYLISLVIPLLLVSSDHNTLEDITGSLEKYITEFPEEKVYIHTDRHHYAQGETIWLKSYLVAGSYHQPSPISNNVYVDLYSPQKELISTILLRSDEGFAAGQIQLPENLRSGSYLLRGYTSWMKNFDHDYFFEKEINILEFDGKVAKAQSTSDTSLDLTFFPEGGQMVSGVAGRIAFKSISSSGLSAQTTGTIYDRDGNEKTKFETAHDGMGFFALTPQANMSYYAVIDGSDKRFELPKVAEQGFSISANNGLPDILRLTFRTNENTPDKEKLHVVIQSRGAVSYAFDLDLSKNIAFSNVPKKTIPSGIAQVTLFNDNGVPLLERLIFVKKDVYNLSVKTDKETYEPREKVTATVQLTDLAGNPAKGNFSLAAVDVSQTITDVPSQTIESNLLLSSDLKGYIENPTYYFEDNDAQRLKHLDLVMMTHGWRKFKWEDLMNKKFPEVTHLIEKGLNIKGQLVDKFNGKPIPNGKVTYFDNSFNPPIIEKVKTDDQGYWEINNIMAYDNSPITLQGENKRGKKLVSFQLDSLKGAPFSGNWVNTEIAEQQAGQLEEFLQKSKERQLIDDAYDFDSTATIVEGVVVEGERFKEEQSQSVYGAGEASFGFDEVTESTRLSRNPLEVLQGRLAGVLITGSGPQVSVQIRGAASLLGGAQPPLILLNDIPTDLQTILYIPAIDIERVEVFKGPSAAIFGANGASGALAFYTYKGAKVTRKPVDGVYSRVLRSAYQGQREFYAPKYAVEKPEHIKPDRRVLMHWEPSVTTDDSGRAVIEFWNSDLPSTVRFDVQGLTLNGQPLVANTTYEVKK